MTRNLFFASRLTIYGLLGLLLLVSAYLLWYRGQADASMRELLGWLAGGAILCSALVAGLGLAFRQQTKSVHRSILLNGQAHQRLAATINASLDAVIVADMHGLILDYNGSAEKIFGYEKEEVMGLNLSEIIIPPHLRTAHKEGLKRYRETEDPKLVGQGTVAISAIRKDGSEFPVELLLQRGEAQDGPIMISYIRDMTEAKAAEKALQEARDAALAADKAKSRFLAVMSHEMRTPLTGLFGALDLIDGTRLTKKQESYLGLAQKSGKALLRHVEDVLDISRIDADQLQLSPSPTHLPDLLKELQNAQGPMAEERGNRILTLVEGMENPVVSVDSHRLRQIIHNLLHNALKFTEDGLVTLSVQEQKIQNGQSKYLFKVDDTGSGIAPEHQPHIFDEFFTQDQSYSRTHEGTGLGLSIVRRLVDLMGGSVDFKSEMGKGAEFWFDLTLPHVDTGTIAPINEPSKPPQDLSRRLMLVEDNATSRLVTSAQLRKLGYEVVEAENGAEAVTKAFDQPLDLILMDISMPVMDGIEATQKIKAGDGPNKTTPILALTAHALPSEQAAFLEAGMLACLTKPINPQSLGQAIEAHLPGATSSVSLDSPALNDLEATLGPDLFNKTLRNFAQETESAFDLFQTALCEDKLSTIQSEAHKALGAAGMLGFHELKDNLRLVEQAAKMGDRETVVEALPVAKATWLEVSQALEAKLAS